jgi:hypothetical protein
MPWSGSPANSEATVPLDDWMPTLKSKLAEITEIRQVHTYLEMPAALAAFPSLILLPVEGRYEYSVGGPQIAHHEVQLTLYTAGQLLPQAFGQAVPLIELVRNKLAANMSLDGTVVTILPSDAAPHYDGPGGVRYGDHVHVGIIFRYHVKEREAGAYPVAA